jgi:hypothetical protein
VSADGTAAAGSVAALVQAFYKSLDADLQSAVLLDYTLDSAKRWSNLPQGLLTGGAGGGGGSTGPGSQSGMPSGGPPSGSSGLAARLDHPNPIADIADQVGTLSIPVVIAVWTAALLTARKAVRPFSYFGQTRLWPPGPAPSHRSSSNVSAPIRIRMLRAPGLLSTVSEVAVALPADSARLLGGSPRCCGYAALPPPSDRPGALNSTSDTSRPSTGPVHTRLLGADA